VARPAVSSLRLGWNGVAEPERMEKALSSEGTPPKVYSLLMTVGVPVLSAEAMRLLDQLTMEQDGVPSLLLMERAGFGVFQKLCEWFAPIENRSVAVVVGKGNNGGDGMVIARYLHEAGARVRLWLTCDPSQFQGDSIVQWRMVQSLGISAVRLPQSPQPELFGEEEVIVDALLGTGARGTVVPPLSEVIEAMNRSGRPIVAVDIPSGLNADTGAVMGNAVRATYTVTMAFPKRGFFQNAGPQHVGHWVAVPIGVVPSRVAQVEASAWLVTESLGRDWLPRWAPDAHKGHRGHVLVVGGSVGMVGAPALSAISALRVGAGLATVGCPARVQPQVASFYPELMTLPLPDEGLGTLTIEGVHWLAERLAKFSVLVLGPGLGQSETVGRAVLELLARWSALGRPLVVDADGLNWLARLGNDVPLPTRTVLTPHPGEAARLLQLDTAEIQQERYGAAQAIAERYRAVCVLKGAYTLIAADERIWVVPIAEPSLGTGGSGDVLTGVIAGFLAQGLAPEPSAIVGAYLHAETGRHLACQMARAYTAEELSRALVRRV